MTNGLNGQDTGLDLRPKTQQRESVVVNATLKNVNLDHLVATVKVTRLCC